MTESDSSWPVAMSASAGQLDMGKPYRGLLQSLLQQRNASACFNSRRAGHRPQHGFATGCFALGRCGFGHAVDVRGASVNFIDMPCFTGAELGVMADHPASPPQVTPQVAQQLTPYVTPEVTPEVSDPLTGQVTVQATGQVSLPTTPKD